MKDKIWYIYGAGGLGRECMDIAATMFVDGDEKPVLKFLVDEPDINQLDGFEVCNFNNHIPDSFVTIAVGEPSLRERLFNKIQNTTLHLKSIISNYSYVSEKCEIENGSIVAPMCSIQNGAKLEKNSLINTMSIVGHDCVINEHSVLSSKVNLGGACIVGKSSFIGMGALVKEKVMIGNSSIVGMSSVVYRDVKDNVIAIGNPARVAKNNDNKSVFK